MQANLRTFKNETFGEVRTLEINGEPWFVGKDVATALGYVKPVDAVRKHVDTEDRGVSKTETPSGAQQMVVINESGLYSLIMGSKLESAKKFKRWVTSEVIPSIRKHGAYMTESALDDVMQSPETIYKMAEAMLEERNKRMSLEAQLDSAKPKITFYDGIVESGYCTNLRTTAKEIGVPEHAFVDYLLANDYIYRSKGTGHLLPYANARNEGKFVVRDYYDASKYGTYLMFTPAGKSTFYELKEDILRFASANKRVGNRKWKGGTLTYDGITKSISEWAEDMDLNYSTLTARLKKGWSVGDALTTPKKMVGRACCKTNA